MKRFLTVYKAVIASAMALGIAAAVSSYAAGPANSTVATPVPTVTPAAR